MKAQKVFCIGWHKTGTTSLGKALTILGYNNCNGASALRRQMGDALMMQSLFKRDYAPLLDYAEQFEAFNDVPWFMMYQELDARFPDSKFILVTREEQAWLASAQRYFGESVSPFRLWIYGKPNPVHFPEVYLHKFRSHYQAVSKYFKERPNDLLVMDLCEMDKWGVLCRFLGLPKPSVPFPHSNQSTSR